MKELKFGDNLPNQGSLYVNLKDKGDKITFRIAKDPVYTGKHFRQVENSWEVLDCPRINNPESETECDLCGMYFGIMGEAKKFKETDKVKYEQLQKEARPFNAAISFYFPVLNRDEKKFQILRTTVGVRNKLNEEFQAGVDIMAVDWVLRNTGSASPRDRYSLIRVDSAQVLPLDDKEKSELEKAASYDMNRISDKVKPAAETEADDSLVEQADSLSK